MFSIFFLRPKDYGLAGQPNAKDYGLASQQMHRFFYVYILVSEIDSTIHYSGLTRALQNRLKLHNQRPLPAYLKTPPVAY